MIEQQFASRGSVREAVIEFQELLAFGFGLAGMSNSAG